MAVPGRGVSLVGGRLSRARALAGGPALPLGASAAAGRVSRGLRSSGVRHDAIIISGTEMAKQIQKEIQRGVESWISLGNRRPHLSIILVGDNPASHTYVRKKIRAASAVGDATVTIAHRYTPKEQLKIHTQLADIIIVAAGIPKLITSDMVKEGAAVIDVGINYVHDPVTGKTKLVGDVDFEAVKKKASFITPVPGGVGPMTVAMLLKNTLLAAKKLIY
uniref:Methylenetetrahydrofolate dehydrogenase (NADP+ dependent) 2 like n=1 Tax=Canis lupus familiaris TaxID=9615 RepID=A0A8C0NX65_CANLF